MNEQFWNYLISRYHIVEEGTIDCDTLYRIIEEVYDLAYDDGRSEGYSEGYDDCLDDNGLDD